MIKMKPDNNVSKKSIGSTMSIDKTPNFFVDKQLDEETSQLDLEKRLGDIWEKTELQKIKERYVLLSKSWRNSHHI